MKFHWKNREGVRPPEFRGSEGRFSVKIAGFALDALALFALGRILHLAVLEYSLHFNFSAAGAEKLVSRDRGSRVLAGLCHILLLPVPRSYTHVRGRPRCLDRSPRACRIIYSLYLKT